jgi:hypothetical protein
MHVKNYVQNVNISLYLLYSYNCYASDSWFYLFVSKYTINSIYYQTIKAQYTVAHLRLYNKTKHLTIGICVGTIELLRVYDYKSFPFRLFDTECSCRGRRVYFIMNI